MLKARRVTYHTSGLRCLGHVERKQGKKELRLTDVIENDKKDILTFQIIV